jgi:hypothetical protein
LRLCGGRILASLIPLFLLVTTARAELIDRIAVSVGNRVITQSDLERQIRVIAFQNGAKPDLSPANKHAVAEKMIQQKLIQRELESSRCCPLPPSWCPPSKNSSRHTSPTPTTISARWPNTSEQDLLDVLLWERQLLRFIELRFETGIQVTTQEVDAYALQKNLPAADAEHALIADRADVQVDQWLLDVRKRTEVIMHEEALQ